MQLVRRNLVYSILVTCSVLLLGVSSCEKSYELTLFHTNDIHSHLRAAKSDPFGLGGLARLSTLLSSKRSEFPVSMTLDAGDWSEGTWYFNVDAGANMLRFLSSLKYDATCLGNHDFLSGPDGIIEMVKQANVSMPLLAANLEMQSYPRKTELLQALPPYMVKTVGDIKVGVIGLTTMEPIYTSYLAPVKITNLIDVATVIARDLKQNQKVNVLIIISHNKFGVNKEIALAVPGVDAVISGHQHLKVPKAELVNAAGRMVPIVETGEWAKFLGELHLKVYKESGAVIYDSYKINPVTPDLAEDPAIVSMIEAQDAILSERHGNVHEHIADSEIDMIQNDNMESPLGNLAVKAYRWATGADLSAEEISLTGVSMARGPLTRMDLHDVVPHIYDWKTQKEWSLYIWNAKGRDVHTLFGAFHMISTFLGFNSPLGWLSSDNTQVIWDPSQQGMGSIRSLRIGGVPIDLNQRYKVAISAGLLKGLITAAEALPFLGLDLTDVTDTGQEVWSSIVSFAASKGVLSRDEFGVGKAVHAEAHDLAIPYYAINLDESGLHVEVENDGMKESPTATVNCYSGLHNDLVSFGTDLQQWSLIGTAALAPIPSQQKVSVTINWNRARLSDGYWPVRCEVTVAGDNYMPNNVGSRVFKLPLQREKF